MLLEKVHIPDSMEIFQEHLVDFILEERPDIDLRKLVIGKLRCRYELIVNELFFSDLGGEKIGEIEILPFGQDMIEVKVAASVLEGFDFDYDFFDSFYLMIWKKWFPKRLPEHVDPIVNAIREELIKFRESHPKIEIRVIDFDTVRQLLPFTFFFMELPPVEKYEEIQLTFTDISQDNEDLEVTSKSSRKPRRDAVERVALALYMVEARDAPTRTDAAKKARTTTGSMRDLGEHPDVITTLEKFRKDRQEVLRVKQKYAAGKKSSKSSK